MQLDKHDTSTVFIFHKDNEVIKLLLVHHKKFDKWMMPGGHVESDENQYECAIREAKEETGLDINIVNFHGDNLGNTFEDTVVIPLPYVIQEVNVPEYKGKPEHRHIDFLYVATTDTNAIQIAERESHDIRWFTEEELIDLNMFESARHLASKLFRVIGEKI
jgi:8-oxo-dGTP pyrophosphatase MutT (NUDIX family)